MKVKGLPESSFCKRRIIITLIVCCRSESLIARLALVSANLPTPTIIWTCSKCSTWLRAKSHTSYRERLSDACKIHSLIWYKKWLNRCNTYLTHVYRLLQVTLLPLSQIPLLPQAALLHYGQFTSTADERYSGG